MEYVSTGITQRDHNSANSNPDAAFTASKVHRDRTVVLGGHSYC